ncbi:SDR family oxidoreductase [Candidatus Nitrosocosmicus hydrocola]|uniref:SDR family oxidoreductase n=1 Tax=Candidatus Nitrosocosmicus hydrocola TaxID=1826872 RepID=UPI0013731531|nr:SDR family oxidoreductase [Candidatus Nitrosocosmicus hydrocola]
MNQKTAIVTGSSSGIGKEISLILARNGYNTFATMRNLDKASELKFIADSENLQSLHFEQLDVTNPNSVQDAITNINNKTGRIDILVNNAGYGLIGAFEDTSIDEVKDQYETNFFGLIRTTQAVLPIMRKQESGLIVNISSGVGRFGIPTLSSYASTKFALEGLTESMSYELEPFGIRTVLVEPGVIKTNFFNSTIVAKKSQDSNSPYHGFMRSMEKNFTELMKNNSSTPEYVAKVVLESITADNPKLRYLAGQDVEQWMDAKRKMTDEEFHNMFKQM